MTVTSAIFFVCAIVAALIHHSLPAKFRKVWLLAISLGFLATWSWKFIIVLGLLTLVNYWIGLHADPANPRSKRWVVFGIVLDVLALFIFKYSDFYLPDTLKLLSRLGITQPKSACMPSTSRGCSPARSSAPDCSSLGSTIPLKWTVPCWSAAWC